MPKKKKTKKTKKTKKARIRLVRKMGGSYLTTAKKPRKISAKNLVKAIMTLMTRINEEEINKAIDQYEENKSKTIKENLGIWEKDRADMDLNGPKFEHPKEKICIDLNEQKINETIQSIIKAMSNITVESSVSDKRTALNDVYSSVVKFFDLCPDVDIDLS